MHAAAPELLVAGPDGPRLAGGRCARCARAHFPPADACPWCGADDVAPARLGPWARLWLWTRVAARPPGYRGPLPYGFGVVTLEDVPLHVVTRLTEDDPARLAAGQRMRLVVARLASADDGGVVETWAFAPTPAP